MAGSGVFKEGDTVVFSLELLDEATGLPIDDAPLVEFTLFGPGVFLLAKSSANAGEVEAKGAGVYEAKFNLGGEGRYTCVMRAVSFAGDEKSEDHVITAERLRGRS